jgi:DNA repair exonuclease SbcCD ATPase subunit
MNLLEKVNQCSVKKKMLVSRKDSLETQLLGKTEMLKSIQEAQALIQTVAKETQEQVKFHIEDIVNMAIDAVFPDMYEFRLIYEIKRNKTEARIVLMEQGSEIDPLEATGGGNNDIIAFALRVALLIISKNRKTLILDEPMKFLSEDVKPKAYEILQRLSSELGIQIIAVSHDPLMIGIADKEVKVKKEEGKSHVCA